MSVHKITMLFWRTLNPMPQTSKKHCKKRVCREAKRKDNNFNVSSLKIKTSRKIMWRNKRKYNTGTIHKQRQRYRVSLYLQSVNWIHYYGVNKPLRVTCKCKWKIPLMNTKTYSCLVINHQLYCKEELINNKNKTKTTITKNTPTSMVGGAVSRLFPGKNKGQKSLLFFIQKRDQ